MPLRDYPKTAAVASGREVLLRPMVPEDERPLREFFLRLSPEDRLFLKDDVTDPAVVRQWAESLDYERVIPLLAVFGDRIVGDATLHRRAGGWSPHVAEIRVVVDSEWRGKGLGALLAREIFHLALSLKLEKVIALMMDSQRGAIEVFRALGFTQEAVLRNHARDQSGAKHDLVIMSEDVETFWRRLEDAIAESHRDRSGDYHTE
jgi:RimJ/RimL family protein N-acetyltransferase